MDKQLFENKVRQLNSIFNILQKFIIVKASALGMLNAKCKPVLVFKSKILTPSELVKPKDCKKNWNCAIVQFQR